MFLTIASIWFGYSIDSEIKKKKEKKIVSEKWLPAALNSCYDLITISAESKRLKESHEKSCDMIDETFNFNDNEQLANMKAVFKIKCNSCAEKMENLKHRIDNGLKQWETFISHNCHKPVCKYMFEKIDERKKELNP